MSGFNNSADGDFSRAFMPSYETFDSFVGQTLMTAGANNAGALGDGTALNKSVATNVINRGINWVQASGGGGAGGFTDGFSAAIKTDGTLWTWGGNSKGQLGQNLSSSVSISSPVTVAGGGTNWKQVACGYLYIAAVKTDGTLWTCGYNNFGQLGTNNTTAISSPTTVAGGGNTWYQVAASRNFSSAIKTDGTLWGWGSNAKGQLGNAAALVSSPVTSTFTSGTDWKQVSCGDTQLAGFTAAIKTDGTLWTWGDNTTGQLGIGTINTSRSSPGTTTAGGTNWKQVACGWQFLAAVKYDGTLWTCGYNTSGQLADGTTSTRSSLVTPSIGGTNWKQVACGYQITMAVKTDGSLWGTGSNFGGSLALGTTTGISTFSQVISNMSGWKSVATGANAAHSLMLGQL